MLKLNCGVSRKTSDNNYGSRGASTHFEVEIESNLIREPAQLKDKIRYLFRLSKEAVDEELAKSDDPVTPPPTNGRAAVNGRSATQSQVRAIHAIASRNRVELPQLLQQRFQADQPGDLSITQASELIDELKAPTNGNGARH
jgi:hypothetical protein